MAIDRTTEAISHFIGLFALSVEKMISREQYSEFRATQNIRDDLEAINAVPFSFDSPYKLKEYDPELSYRPTGSALASSQPTTTGALIIPQGDVVNFALAESPGSGIATIQAAGSTVAVSFTLAAVSYTHLTLPTKA